MRRIEYYRTKNGKCYVEEFLDSLNDKEFEKVFYSMRLVEDLEIVPSKFFKKLKGTDDIYEIRAEYKGKWYRLFSFFYNNNLVIATHGVQKKDNKVKRSEIEKAQKYKKDYYQQKTERK